MKPYCIAAMGVVVFTNSQPLASYSGNIVHAHTFPHVICWVHVPYYSIYSIGYAFVARKSCPLCDACRLQLYLTSTGLQASPAHVWAYWSHVEHAPKNFFIIAPIATIFLYVIEIIGYCKHLKQVLGMNHITRVVWYMHWTLQLLLDIALRVVPGYLYYCRFKT